MAPAVIGNPILNSPFREPVRHREFTELIDHGQRGGACGWPVGLAGGWPGRRRIDQIIGHSGSGDRRGPAGHVRLLGTAEVNTGPFSEGWRNPNAQPPAGRSPIGTDLADEAGRMPMATRTSPVMTMCSGPAPTA